MHHFPRTDLARVIALAGDPLPLALLASLRFVARADLRRAGVGDEALRRLEGQQLVMRLPLQRSLADGVPIDVFALRRAGAAALANELNVDASTVRAETLSTVRRSANFMDHSLAISRFAIRLALARRDDGPALVRWDAQEASIEISEAEPANKRGPRDGRLVPDAMARLERADGDEVILLEVDRNTERNKFLSAKYAAYACAWRSGILARRFGATAIRVLTVAPTARRAERMRKAAQEATALRLPGLFWFSDEESLDMHGIAGPVWRKMTGAPLALWKAGTSSAAADAAQVP